MEKVNLKTTDMVDENIKRIGEMFPNCLTEVKDENGRPQVAIDFDQLRQELSKDIVEGPVERYQFTWPDKRNAIRLANAPTTDTLRPVRNDETTPTGADSEGNPYCSTGSVNFDTTENLYIEGDNLQVLKLLREDYLGKIKMIYIDPPYNTGNDFVYDDDFSQSSDAYIHNSGQTDANGNRLVTNTESNGRFHTDWLNMIYPRMKVAKDLLSDDGVIFISIDDNEQRNLRNICDDIFGESNFICNCIWKSKSGGANDSRHIAVDHEYVLCYAKKADSLKTFMDKEAAVTTSYNQKDEKGEYSLDRLDKQSLGYIESLDFPIIGPDGKTYVVEHKNPKVKVARWRWSKETVQQRYDELVFKNGYVYTKNYKKEANIARSLLLEDRFGRTRTGKTDFTSMFDATYFSAPKPVKLIYYLIGIVGDKNATVLDFFSGSSTTAHATMLLNAEDKGNRKYIMVQLPEVIDKKSDASKAGYQNICEIGKERIRRAGKKIKEEHPEAKDLDIGFRVLKLDTSNMEDVQLTPKQYTQASLFADNLKSGRTEEDLLFQTMLRLGIDLSAKIETFNSHGKTVFNVNDNYLLACFDTDVNESAIEEIAKRQPVYFVMRDASLASDNVRDNIDQLWKHYNPGREKDLIII